MGVWVCVCVMMCVRVCARMGCCGRMQTKLRAKRNSQPQHQRLHLCSVTGIQSEAKLPKSLARRQDRLAVEWPHHAEAPFFSNAPGAIVQLRSPKPVEQSEQFPSSANKTTTTLRQVPSLSVVRRILPIEGGNAYSRDYTSVPEYTSRKP